jgi:hypothetical protein
MNICSVSLMTLLPNGRCVLYIFNGRVHEAARRETAYVPPYLFFIYQNRQ